MPTLRVIALCFIASTTLCACSFWQAHEDSPTYRVSRQFTAKGFIAGVEAHTYGDRTIVRFKGRPVFLSFEDIDGREIEYEREGEYYRLNRHYDVFIARSNLIRVTLFSADKDRIPPQNPPDKVISPRNDKTNAVKVNRVRMSLNDDISYNAYSSTYTQRHSPYSSTFSPSKENEPVLIRLALRASRIYVRGRTDSHAPGALDRRIANDRATNASKWLISHGVKPELINETSMASGGHVVPNTTHANRDKNRRVEIEMLTSQIN